MNNNSFAVSAATLASCLHTAAGALAHRITLTILACVAATVTERKVHTPVSRQTV
jgi:hypothetical protein